MPADNADNKLTKQQRADMAFRYLDWLLTKNVPSGGFRLLYAITQFFNDQNPFHCFPSIETLAERIGRSPSTVWSMLPKLEKIGAIEIEWGSKGSGHPNVYRLPEPFLAFYFGPEKGRLPPDPGPKKPRQTGVSKPRQTGVSDQLENPDTPPKKPRYTVKKPRHIGVSHFLTTDSHKKERGPAARSADDDRDSPSNQRAPEVALIEPVAANQQPPCRATSKEIGPPTDAFAKVYQRGREVLGDDADVVIAELLDAYDGDTESALDTIAAAEEERSSESRRQYVEKDIETAARAPPMR